MATKTLESDVLSSFCESIAVMHAAGIQMDEAVSLLGENMKDAAFRDLCDRAYAGLVDGKSLATSLEEAGNVPVYLVGMVRIGERTGRLESVLRNLAKHYEEENRLYLKVRNAIAYPAALLGVMSVILLFTVIAILPVFIDVYRDLAGGLTTGSFSYVSVALGIGWTALIVTLVCTALVLVGIGVASTTGGRRLLLRLFERVPFTRAPLRQIAVSRFTTALATFVSAGVDTDTAMGGAVSLVENPELKSRLERARDEMADPTSGKSLSQAIADNDVFDPVYARMLAVGTRSGSTETVLDSLSSTFFDDAIARIDGVIDSVEPALAAFLTVSVGATLVSVMLPLIGIMRSIG